MGSNCSGTISPDENAAFWQTYVPEWRAADVIDFATILKAYPSMDQAGILLLIEELRRVGEVRITNGVIIDEIRGVDPPEASPLKEQP